MDSFIKRDSVADFLDDEKVSPKVLEQLQKLASEHNNAELNIFDPKLKHKMTSEKGFFVQHRREYYNDFEDCIRDYKNAKIKSLQKQTKIHLSDGDNGESDSDYVDCNDSSDLKHQSSLSSKSMPHVLTGNYEDNFRQQLELKQTATTTTMTTTTTKRIELEAQAQTEKPPTTEKAQLNTNYDVLQVVNTTSAQLPSPPHNNNPNLNLIIDARRASSIKSKEKLNDRKQSIERAMPSTSTTTKGVQINQKVENASEVVKPTPVQITVKREEQAKRKSCKKKSNGETKGPEAQRWCKFHLNISFLRGPSNL